MLSRFIDAELRDELLFREALQRGLQYRDVAIEQRIIRNMRFLDADTEAERSPRSSSRAMRCGLHINR